ncbi:alpha/beta hydrolase [Micromonospora krabiensis]|uniref:Alpha/beta hydrolase n=1 Tax=Micromonospora krabiensis TaxID=307121 RepID=A0A1C3NDT2_9ACTN|nr:alpha/beta hydrolase [Micromonospora krabiensis]SBV30757.1 Alpha/beta hydrolase [Micromonospora krabiensis]
MHRTRATRAALAVLLGVGLVLPTPPEPVTAAGFVEAYPATAAAMRAAGPPYADWVGAGRRFLLFDPRGDGRAVEVRGDLAVADRIVVLVPGVGSTLRDFDRGLGGVPRRAPAVQAGELHRAMRAADPDARVAVLAWLGYDPPDGVLAAAGPADARAGAVALRGLLRGLAARRPGATVTLVGHSYGALVAGLAVRGAPAQVTDVVTLGGVGTGVDRAAALGTGRRVWAAEAPDDWIRRVPQVRLPGLGHGRRPADPAFGAYALPVAGAHGHDGYLVPGSATLAAVAAVALTGAADPAATARTADAGAGVAR